MVLGRVVDVTAGDVEAFGHLGVVDVRLDAGGVAHREVVVEVVGHKLFRALVLPDDRRLPGEELGDQRPLELLKFRGEAAVDGAVDIGDVFPGVDPVAPVVEAEGAV